jgi:hypothetical protein
MDPQNPYPYRQPPPEQSADEPWPPATSETTRLGPRATASSADDAWPRKPDKVQVIAVLSLVDGIVNMLLAVGWIFTFCGAPLGIYAMVVGIFSLVYASRLLSSRPRGVDANTTLAILQIVNIISGNLFSLITGIMSLIMYNDPDVEEYFRRINRP